MRTISDAKLRELILTNDSELFDAFSNVFIYKKLAEQSQNSCWSNNAKEFYKFCYQECCQDLPLSQDEIESSRVKNIFNDVFIDFSVGAMSALKGLRNYQHKTRQR